MEKATPSQVKAWLATVLAPLLTGLGVELQVVGKGSVSFRTNGELEFLTMIHLMVSPPLIPNLQQFKRYHPDVAKLCADHDVALETLRQTAVQAFDVLVGSAEFKAAVSAYAAVHDPRIFAEHVVNGVKNLPMHYGGSAIWNQNAAAFLSLRAASNVRAMFDALDTRRAEFNRIAIDLFRRLSELQEELADQYGLPPVDPSVAAVS